MTYRNDPEWQQAREDYLRDQQEGETPGEVVVRRVHAAYRMNTVESRYEAR